MSDIDLHYLARRYGQAFTGCTLTVSGANRTYRLIADRNCSYYLRLYRPAGRTRAEIAFELRLLREARPIPGIDVARPIRTVDGADCVHLPFDNARRTACLFQALDGRPLTDSHQDAALFGSALAKLHAALVGIDGGAARPLDPAALCMLANAWVRSIPGSDTVRGAIAHCRDAILGDSATYSLPSGNCHGDARMANAVVRDGTVGFFDFDDCGCGPYLLDLGTAAWHFLDGDPSRTEALVTALLTGYERDRPLSGVERRALPHFVKLAEVRALLFLAGFCTPAHELWPRAFDRATSLLMRELTI